MTEVDLFKVSYFQGRLILIQGPPGTRKIRMTYQLLRRCQVDVSEVTLMSASLFSEQFVEGVSGFLMRGIRVFLVNRLESLDPLKQKAFIQALAYSKQLFFACGIRVILIASEEDSSSLEITEEKAMATDCCKR